MAANVGKTVLLTLGRLPVALELARAFHSAGWRVVVTDPGRQHLCRMSSAVDRNLRVTAPVNGAARFLEDLTAIIDRESVDLVVPVSEETLYVAGLGDTMDKPAAIFAGRQSSLLDLHDKYRFNRLAVEAGLPVPVSATGDTVGKVEWPGNGIVIKPRYSASGRGVRFATASNPGKLDASMVVQERLTGEELSGFALARSGRVEACVVYRPKIRSGSVAVCFERVTDAADIEAWMGRFISHAGHTGFIGFDFIRDGNCRKATAKAIECNPRATSGLHFLDHRTIVAIAAAGIDSARTGQPGLRRAAKLMEGYSCFTALLGSLGSPPSRAGIWKDMREARDVCWTRRDPLPFLLMTINTWPVIWRAMTTGRSFAEVAVADIEWQAGND